MPLLQILKRWDGFFRSPKGVVTLCCAFFALIVWTFAPALQCNFQYYDELDALLKNPHVNSGISWQNCIWAFCHFANANWYPLTWISHMLDFTLYGFHPWGHHLTNVLFHAANAVLLFLVLKRMSGALWRSLVVASLFALHPLRVESVAWISERKDVLSTFFWMLALWAYVRFAEESRKPRGQGGTLKFYGLTFAFFICGLMSKPMVITLPCVLLLLDFWPLGRWQENGWRLVWEKAPFFAVIPFFSVVFYLAQESGGTLQEMNYLLWEPRVENAFVSYARYLGKFFYPANLCAYYPHPGFWPGGLVLMAFALVAGSSLLARQTRRRLPYFFVGWFWFVGTAVPIIGLVQLISLSSADRYTYIPMIGVALLLVWGVNDLLSHWRERHVAATTVFLTAAVGATLMVCIARTRVEIGYWKDSATLWRRVIVVTKNNYKAHYCLGNILFSTDPDQAMAEFQASVNINPDQADAQRDLAWLLERQGRFKDAIFHYEVARLIEPQNSWTYHGLASCLTQLGQLSNAVPLLLKAVEADPKNAGYKDNLEGILSVSGHEIETLQSLLEAARSDPNGFERIVDAVNLDTNRMNFINYLAWSFATNPDPKLRNGPFAVRLATRTCEMTRFQNPVCLGTLAAAFAEESRFDDATSTAQRACSLAASTSQPAILKRNQELLELFRSHRPFHETATKPSR